MVKGVFCYKKYIDRLYLVLHTLQFLFTKKHPLGNGWILFRKQQN